MRCQQRNPVFETPSEPLETLSDRSVSEVYVPEPEKSSLDYIHPEENTDTNKPNVPTSLIRRKLMASNSAD
jgi:hypothetical protein